MPVPFDEHDRPLIALRLPPHRPPPRLRGQHGPCAGDPRLRRSRFVAAAPTRSERHADAHVHRVRRLAAGCRAVPPRPPRPARRSAGPPSGVTVGAPGWAHRRRRHPAYGVPRAPAARAPPSDSWPLPKTDPCRTAGRARPSWRRRTVTSRARVSCAAGGWTGAVAEDRPACDNSKMSPGEPGEPKSVRGHCPSCGSGCKAYVRGEHAVHSTDPDDGISARSSELPCQLGRKRRPKE